MYHYSLHQVAHIYCSTPNKRIHGVWPKLSNQENSFEIVVCKIYWQSCLGLDVLTLFLFSIEGYVSHRRREQGSWFIKSLCQELRLCHDDTEIMDLLTRVNYHVAYEFESSANKVGRGNKQVPCIMSVLTKKMYIKKKWKLSCVVTLTLTLHLRSIVESKYFLKGPRKMFMLLYL